MAQNPFKFGSSKYDDWNYTHGGQSGTDQALADAKGTLASSGRFLDSVTPQEEAPAPNEPNGLLNMQGSVFDSSYDKLARLGRQIVRPIPAAVEGAAGVGSFLPGPVGLASRGVLGVKSGADLISGGMSGLSEHPVRSALDVGGVAAGLSSLKGLKALASGASEAENMANMLGGRAMAYEGGAGARPAGRPAVGALDKLLHSPSFENLPKGEVSMAGRAPRVPAMREPDITGYHAQDLLENPSSQAYAEQQFNRNKPVADMVFGGRNPKMVEANLSPAVDDLAKRYGRKPLDPMERLAARSSERFGRRFRRE